MDFPISDFAISTTVFKSGRMEDFLETLPDQDYGDLLDYAKLEDLEEISKRLRHGLLPDLDGLGVLMGETKNAQKNEADQLDDARLEVISQRQKELTAEMDEIDNRLSEIRKINVQSDTELGQKAKEEERMLRKEDRRKEKEFIEEAEHELQERGGGGGRRENHGFWPKGDGGKKLAKYGRLSRKEHFFRDKYNQNIHSRLGPWMEKSSSTRHPYKRSYAKVRSEEGQSENSNKKQSYFIVDQVGMLD